MDDAELPHELADHRSEEAFRTLVDRHIDFVYSVAFRQVGDKHRAEEVVQSVFTDLAAKASQLPENSILAGGTPKHKRSFPPGRCLSSVS